MSIKAYEMNTTHLKNGNSSMENRIRQFTWLANELKFSVERSEDKAVCTPIEDVTQAGHEHNNSIYIITSTNYSVWFILYGDGLHLFDHIVTTIL